MWIQDLHVKHRVDTNLDIIPRNTDLFGDVECLFLQAVPIGNAVDERDQNMETSVERAAVLAEIFDYVRALLWNDGRGARDHDHGNDG